MAGRIGSGLGVVIDFENLRTSKNQRVFKNYPYLKFYELYNKSLKVRTIIQIVSDYYGISIEDIKGSVRKREFLTPRYVLISILHANGFGLTQIGQYLSKRDHTTCINGIRTLNCLTETDHTILHGCDAVMELIYNAGSDEVTSKREQDILTLCNKVIMLSPSRLTDEDTGSDYITECPYCEEQSERIDERQWVDMHEITHKEDCIFILANKILKR